jgi:mono/diheme cytochrome c family protein
MPKFYVERLRLRRDFFDNVSNQRSPFAGSPVAIGGSSRHNSDVPELRILGTPLAQKPGTSVRILRLALALTILFRAPAATRAQDSPANPTFYRDIQPILEQHCQSCHRAGEIGPMPLVTYGQVGPLARAIADSVGSRRMPPWFADPSLGHFQNDPSLSPAQINAIASWAAAGAPAGNRHDAPAPRKWVSGWNIPAPDAVVEMPKPVPIPAEGDVDYTYEIVPTGFTDGKWVRMSEIRPSSRENVHHAVVYVRPPDSDWLRHAPLGIPFTAADMTDEQDRHDTHTTKADILLVYAPGSSPDKWPAGMAKFIPAGSDLVFQMHYTTRGRTTTDHTKIGLVFAKQPPAQRVLTLQLTNSDFVIPPGVDDYRVEVHGTIPNDAVLLSFFPHMHLRGKRFEYNILHSDGRTEPLLRVNYNFYWQLSYRLADPLPIAAGTTLQAVAWFDNSKNNPHNPDPTSAVYWGDQTYDEMMVGFFDVAVPANIDKNQFFIRQTPMHGHSH